VILVDTSIWIDHLRGGDNTLAALLAANQVLAHSWVIGEIALGHLAQRSEILGLLSNLPQAIVGTPVEVMTLVERQRLYGPGIGYVGAQLLASTRLTAHAQLWTRDARLATAAVRLGCAVDPGYLPNATGPHGG